MKLFLDDRRKPHACVSYMHHRIGKLNPIYLDEWVTVKTYREFVEMVTNHHKEITHISYDHDLGVDKYGLKLTDCFTNENGKLEKGEHYFEDDGFCILCGSSIDQASLGEVTIMNMKTGYDCAKWMKEFYDANKLEYPVMFVHSQNTAGTDNIIHVFK